MNLKVITLIPKQPDIKHISQFRPISLCTTIYKVLAKIVVSKLKPLLPKIVHRNQASYVPGKNISYNIIIAQEILHRYNKASGRQGYFAWKIDLSKAYDRLCWKYIDMVLQDAGMDNSFKQLIMKCITTVRYRVLVNAALSDLVTPTCGIRQGDPLSPYIFVLCMDKLSRLIDLYTTQNLWKPVRASRSGPLVSHLFFADDLILFAEASINQMILVKQCLDLFCSWSGQKVIFEKSKLFCSSNTPDTLAHEIARICGLSLVNDLGSYLGVPLIHVKAMTHTYSHVVDKMKQRLLPWKMHTLSMAGRIVYAKAVLTTIPLYTMHTALLPKSLCSQMDRIVWDFIWGMSDTKKAWHLISWDMVSRPKYAGGLAIPKMHDRSIALLAKQGW